MFRNLILVTAAATFVIAPATLLAAAPSDPAIHTAPRALDDGEITSINNDEQQIVVRVGDVEHTISVSSVELLDAEGNAIEIDDLSVGGEVSVTFDGETPTKVQLKA